MLSCIRRPTITYDLAALATDACVSVGRETDSQIQLDSQDIPCLLSRRHATLVLQPGGNFTIVDLGSTNGTFTARQNQPLRKLPAGYAWDLQHGDTVGFGGPETIIVKREQVSNPFLFKYYHFDAEHSGPLAQQQPQQQQQLTVRPSRDTTTLPLPPTGHMLHSGGLELQGSNGQPVPHVSTINRTLSIPVPQQTHTPFQQPDNDNNTGISDRYSLSSKLSLKQQTLHVRSPNTLTSNGKENKGHSQPHTTHLPTACSTPRSKKMADVLCSHLSCPVCCEWLVASHTLSCGHMFCGLCLATWLNQNQSCPSCRKAITSLPVRCFQVDAAVTELLALQQQSPVARKERKRKQEHWDNIQRHIVQDWATSLQRRRDAALMQATRHNQELQVSHDPHHPVPVPVVAAAPVMHHPPVQPRTVLRQ